MRTRSAVGVLLALLLAGSAVVTAAPVQAESAPVEPVQAVISSPLDCDGVVAVPDGYLLTQDTECSLSWYESDKSFDLGGHTFTGHLRTGALGRNLKVHDGTLQVRAHDSWLSADTTFSRVRIRPAPDQVPWGFFIVVGTGFTLEHSVVEDVPGIAFDLYTSGSRSTFRNSVFRNNGAPFSIQKASDVVMEGNWFIENGTGVNLWPEDGNGVNGNVIRRNVFVGNSTAVSMSARCYNNSHCDFGAGRAPVFDNNRIEHNLIVNSRFSGIAILRWCPLPSSSYRCMSAAGNVIRGNIITGSGYDPAAASSYDDGITARGSYVSSSFPRVETPHPELLAGFTLSGNLAIHNADLGFDVMGVTDGGRNLAFANGNPDQCDGVRCTLRRPPHRDLAGAPLSSLDDLMPLYAHPETESDLEG